MSVHVLLNILNELGKRDRILSLFRNSFNKFNITGAQMLDSIYHMTIKLLFNHFFEWISLNFTIYTRRYYKRQYIEDLT